MANRLPLSSVESESFESSTAQASTKIAVDVDNGQQLTPGSSSDETSSTERRRPVRKKKPNTRYTDLMSEYEIKRRRMVEKNAPSGKLIRSSFMGCPGTFVEMTAANLPFSRKSVLIGAVPQKVNVTDLVGRVSGGPSLTSGQLPSPMYSSRPSDRSSPRTRAHGFKSIVSTTADSKDIPILMRQTEPYVDHKPAEMGKSLYMLPQSNANNTTDGRFSSDNSTGDANKWISSSVDDVQLIPLSEPTPMLKVENAEESVAVDLESSVENEDGLPFGFGLLSESSEATDNVVFEDSTPFFTTNRNWSFAGPPEDIIE